MVVTLWLTSACALHALRPLPHATLFLPMRVLDVRTPLKSMSVVESSSAATNDCATIEQQCLVPRTPSVGDLLSFCVPLLGMGIISPVLSLVDSSVVGRRSTIQLAALAPATALVDRSTYVFAFLGATTTNFIATARAQQDIQAEARHVENAISLALAFGVALAAALTCASRPLLHRMVCPTLLADAHAYENGT